MEEKPATDSRNLFRDTLICFFPSRSNQAISIYHRWQRLAGWQAVGRRGRGLPRRFPCAPVKGVVGEAGSVYPVSASPSRREGPGARPLCAFTGDLPGRAEPSVLMTKHVSSSWKLSKLQRTGFLGFEIVPLASSPRWLLPSVPSFIHSFNTFLPCGALNVTRSVEDIGVDRTERESPFSFGAHILGRISGHGMCGGQLRLQYACVCCSQASTTARSASESSRRCDGFRSDQIWGGGA